MPADRARLLDAIGRGLVRLGAAPAVLATIPADCPLADLERYDIDLDSIQLLELVVVLEEDLGQDLDLPEVSDDWQTYTWGRLLDDLAIAATDRRSS